MLYLTLLVITISFCTFFYFLIIRKAVDNQVEVKLNAGLDEVVREFDSMLDKANEYSKMIGYSGEVQSYLKNLEQSGEGNQKAKIESSSISIVVGSSFVDSVYIYDFQGNCYAATDNFWRADADKSIETAEWYEDAMKATGGCIVRINSSGFLEWTGADYISVIRVINDIDTLEPMGIMILNVSFQKITSAFDGFAGEQEMDLQITEQDGTILYSNTGDSTLTESDIREPNLREMNLRERNLKGLAEGTEEGRFSFVLDGAGYQAACTKDHTTGLMIYDAVKTGSIRSQYQMYMYALLLLGIMDIIIVGCITQIVEWTVSRPISLVLASMKEIDKKHFKKLQVMETNHEMTRLQEGYNTMIDQIHQLFEDVMSEQKMKRKYELNVLNAQIRPHFLYNTFDAVCALALMKRSEDVYKLMQALGEYYRTSLHKGDETITLREELSIIKNYIVIQKYRFENLFDVCYQVDEQLMDCRILKLILQPFVENSIYHGLKTKNAEGTILIRGYREGSYLILSVWDDGMGMSREKIRKILHGEVVEEEKSFGVYGTVERIALYYNQEGCVDIKSQQGKGTEIIIRIPLEHSI